MTLRVGFVVPRYGAEVIGGAEHAVRSLARNLVSAGFTVEVLTTNATDYRTWRPELPVGAVVEDAVLVRRFAVEGGRHPDFDRIGGAVLSEASSASLADQRGWLRAQGPHSPALLDAIAHWDGDVLCFSPYLYEPAVLGIELAQVPTVLLPAAHDEPALSLSMMEAVFSAADVVACYADAEAELVTQRFQLGHRNVCVVGLGLEPPPPIDPELRPGLGALVGAKPPYLLCLGRVDDGKGAGVLARMYHAGGLVDDGLGLVYAGPIAQTPPAGPGLVTLGPVSEAEKWALLRGSTALVSPSPHESFSFAIMESWQAGRPVLVNAACSVTAEHAARSGGGIAFAAPDTFAALARLLLRQPAVARQIGARGSLYVQQNYSWPTVIARLGHAFDVAIATASMS
ncbi:MAG: glycosyltransferase family 4 protein [Actinobacteria bacterium]|nr:glycosyltransferase family 4 protein [Actinomycetota bacterium]MCB9390604.1 glycosyltransferase family 4 protein [Acidimicrobiia bacterium]